MPPRRRDLPRADAFDPLARLSLENVLRERLEAQPRVALPPDQFKGAGIYALYYQGDLPLYRSLSGTQVPIYVGKAEAGNSDYGDLPDEDGFQLSNRIRKHAASIGQAENIATTDFLVRYLPLDDAWIVLSERALLRAYRPVLWNTIVSGFGANPPGVARKNARSEWDTQHPGRDRAGGLCHRHWTYEEQVQRITRAIELSLLPDGPARTEGINQLRAQQRQAIWRPNNHGRRILVRDRARFEGEMARLGLEIPGEVDYDEAQPEG